VSAGKSLAKGRNGNGKRLMPKAAAAAAALARFGGGASSAALASSSRMAPAVPQVGQTSRARPLGTVAALAAAAGARPPTAKVAVKPKPKTPAKNKMPLPSSQDARGQTRLHGAGNARPARAADDHELAAAIKASLETARVRRTSVIDLTLSDSD